MKKNVNYDELEEVILLYKKGIIDNIEYIILLELVNQCFPLKEAWKLVIKKEYKEMG